MMTTASSGCIACWDVEPRARSVSVGSVVDEGMEMNGLVGFFFFPPQSHQLRLLEAEMKQV